MANTIGFPVGDDTFIAGSADQTLYPPSGRQEFSLRHDSVVCVPAFVVRMTALNSATFKGYLKPTLSFFAAKACTSSVLFCNINHQKTKSGNKKVTFGAL
jgi:hypothetical protein